MRRYLLWGCVLLLTGPSNPARAEPRPPRLVEEYWEAAYLERAKTGHAHITVHEVERGGKKVLRTTLSIYMTVLRYNALVPVRMATSTDETADGKVVALSMTLFLDKGMKIEQTAEVEGDRLLLRTPREPEGKPVPWDEKVLGLHKQQRLFQDRKVKPGDRFAFKNYELAVQTAVKVQVTVKEPELVDLLVEKKDGERTMVERVKQSLLRVEGEGGKIEIEGRSVPLPPMVWWLDRDRRIVRYEMDMPGMGRLTFYRTSRAVAEKVPVKPAPLPDLGFNSLITLKAAIAQPTKTRAIVYRITAAGDDDPKTIFTADSRQTVRNVKDKTFDLHIRAIRAPVAVKEPKEVGAEFLEGNAFLDTDSEAVKTLAARVVGDETDAWTKAQRIEKWVHDNMSSDNGIGFAKASKIAEDRKGDCRQHAILTAALCRAVRVPSRTAIGLVYVRDPDHGPVLGFHMWTEVHVKGQWLGLDAIQGLGSIGADHLKIADHSWRNVQTLAPLLPVLRALGKPKITVDVVSTE